jgi:hypothetical protein
VGVEVPASLVGAANALCLEGPLDDRLALAGSA